MFFVAQTRQHLRRSLAANCRRNVGLAGALCRQLPFSHAARRGVATNLKPAPQRVSTALKCWIAFGGLAASAAWTMQMRVQQCDAPSRPVFSRKQVAEHKSTDSIWVIYKGGVYDITTFVAGHPGGEKILLAAGGSVEPYWNVYTIHNKQAVRDILEQYRIGDLDPRDLEAPDAHVDIADPFSGDPVRSPIFIVRSAKPYNGETPGTMLTDHFVTPNDLFYIRNHLPVPKIDAAKFELEISGLGVEKTLKLTLDELKSKFPVVKVMASLQCAGNRRKDMTVAGPVQGLLWQDGAIGNAEWTGVWLRDLLKHAGYAGSEEAEHVQFEGLDGYGASVPIGTALNPEGDVLVAFAMNNEPIPRDHGFPLRVLIPGHVAARSVKWVNRIIVSKQESASHWQQNDYKGFSPSTDWDHLDYTQAEAIQEMPVQSAILDPRPEAKVDTDSDEISVKGYAWSGGGRGITRVDVSSDGGKTWHAAALKKSDQRRNKVWAWTQWEATVPIQQGDAPVELVCKAVDTSYNVQPDSFDGIYNRRGVLSNAWHRISLKRQQP